MSALNKFNQFSADLANGVHNLGSDDLRVYLTNVAPVATNTVYNTPADLSTANGYTAGGAAPSHTSSSQTSGTYTLVISSATWTASGGSFGPFRYAVYYNNSAASKQLIGWVDYGIALTITDGTPFSVSPASYLIQIV